MADPYLTMNIWDDPDRMKSPPYQALLKWCTNEGIPAMSGDFLTVWDANPETGDPIIAVLDTYNLDDAGQPIRDEDGNYVTHPVTYYPGTLPPLRNGIIPPTAGS